MKYIIFEDSSGNPIPVLFPQRIMHDEMRGQLPYATVLSAGYANLGPNGFVCHGRSRALAAAAAEGDADIMARHFSPDADC